LFNFIIASILWQKFWLPAVRDISVLIQLLDKKGLSCIFDNHKDIEGVIHFAANIAVEESVQQPLAYYQNNLVSLLNILAEVVEYRVPNFVFSSSCTVYGKRAEMPVNESSPPGSPASPYGATKQMSERIIDDLVKSGDLDRAVILRYFNPAGAHESGLIGENPRHPVTHLLPVIGEVAKGKRDYLSVFGADYPTRDGTCIRDYIHVSDLADAHVDALAYSMQGSFSGTEYFNLGSGNGVSVKEMVAAFEKETGISIPTQMADRRPGDLPAIYADTSKALRVLEWKPRRTLDDIMHSAWEFEKNRKGLSEGR
jgi:UDP-glucose 4-epimerase